MPKGFNILQTSRDPRNTKYGFKVLTTEQMQKLSIWKNFLKVDNELPMK